MRRAVGALLLVLFCLTGNAFAATGAVQPSQDQDLAQLKAAIFQAPAEPGDQAPATPDNLIGKLSNHRQQKEDCSQYSLPCAVFQCDCRNRCAPCGGVQQALCFNVCNCVNPGC